MHILAKIRVENLITCYSPTQKYLFKISIDEFLKIYFMVVRFCMIVSLSRSIVWYLSVKVREVLVSIKIPPLPPVKFSKLYLRVYDTQPTTIRPTYRCLHERSKSIYVNCRIIKHEIFANGKWEEKKWICVNRETKNMKFLLVAKDGRKKKTKKKLRRHRLTYLNSFSISHRIAIRIHENKLWKYLGWCPTIWHFQSFGSKLSFIV